MVFRSYHWFLRNFCYQLSWKQHIERLVSHTSSIVLMQLNTQVSSPDAVIKCTHVLLFPAHLQIHAYLMSKTTASTHTKFLFISYEAIFCCRPSLLDSVGLLWHMSVFSAFEFVFTLLHCFPFISFIHYISRHLPIIFLYCNSLFIVSCFSNISLGRPMFAMY